jgi:glucose/arabinose dehydrogenase/mono/diheme cytochrome c family protein
MKLSRTFSFAASAIAVTATLLALCFGQPAFAQDADHAKIKPGARIVLLGNGLGSRMLHYGYFETELQLRYPNHKLFIRNICDEGNTPSFRPHSGRKNQLGFPGAEEFHGPYSDNNTADGIGHFETDEQWLTRLKPDVIIAFFGFNESFQGGKGLANFRKELDAFVNHTITQKYNGKAAAELILVTPVGYENLSAKIDVPKGHRENQNLAAYTSVMLSVADDNYVMSVDAFSPSLKWYQESNQDLTTDGALLNDAGYKTFSTFLVDQIFGKTKAETETNRKKIAEAVRDKNWLWTNNFKIPNGVHVFGRRYNPFGPKNYPFEIEKIREMTAIRDQAIWAILQGKRIDIAALDAKTSTLPAVKTNYRRGGKNGELTFLKGDAALKTITVPGNYRIEQWASEQEFPDLANPVQMAFDNQGRLWVATMPSYPHWYPGSSRPNDKLLILEDTNNDGKADKQTIFAEGLHLPMGFEISHDGVYVSQGINLVKLSDTDGDGKADRKEIILSGFDDHDTHHAIGAYTADPSGALYMCEGVFLRTNVETAYGPVRATDGGFYRYSPQRKQLERHAQLRIPNPWGVTFDHWGQHFFLHTSGTTVEWMLPGSVKPRYGVASPGSKHLIEPKHRVRPTAGIEFLHSRHFPDEVQGDMLLCNDIGFRGTKQHKMMEEGTGYSTKWRQDLTVSSDGNYRPVDLEVAPDGSLFIVDWHNPLIGHMQHNARDPNRDHLHGRIYRITYPSRPLVKPATIAGAPIETLLNNLKLPEYRSRYRTRRELRARKVEDVLAGVTKWVATLDKSDDNYEHQLLEALWVTWGMNKVDQRLLNKLLVSKDHRARAAAVLVLRYTGHQVEDQVALLEKAATDPHGRVKLEAIVAASWLKKSEGLGILAAAENKVADPAKPKPEQNGKLVKINGGGKTIEVTVPKAAQGKVTSFTMTLPGNDRTINLSEMVITSGKKHITKLAKLSQSSLYNGNRFPATLLVDGDLANFAHTNEEKNPWIKVEFKSPTAFDKIKIWNRADFEGRFSDARFDFMSGSNKLATLNIGPLSGGPAVSGNSAFDSWIAAAFRTSQAHLNNQTIVQKIVVKVPAHITGDTAKSYVRGAEIYQRDGHCATCHQADGLGLEPAGFPPLAKSPWVNESEERLIKITLHGMVGPIQVMGKKYPGLVPMTPFGGMLNDSEVADVLTYVRNSFGNKTSAISPAQVKRVRAETKSRDGFYTPQEILKLHPHK